MSSTMKSDTKTDADAATDILRGSGVLFGSTSDSGDPNSKCTSASNDYPTIDHDVDSCVLTDLGRLVSLKQVTDIHDNPDRIRDEKWQAFQAERACAYIKWLTEPRSAVEMKSILNAECCCPADSPLNSFNKPDASAEYSMHRAGYEYMHSPNVWTSVNGLAHSHNASIERMRHACYFVLKQLRNAMTSETFHYSQLLPYIAPSWLPQGFGPSLLALIEWLQAMSSHSIQNMIMECIVTLLRAIEVASVP